MGTSWVTRNIEETSYPSHNSMVPSSSHTSSPPTPTPIVSMASQVEQVKRAQTLALVHRFQGVNYTAQATFRSMLPGQVHGHSRMVLGHVLTSTFWFRFTFAAFGVCEDTAAFHSIWKGKLSLTENKKKESKYLTNTHTHTHTHSVFPQRHVS